MAPIVIVFSCDRCKQPVERNKGSIEALQEADLPNGLKVYGQFHLCNQCATRLKSFITEPELWHRSDDE